MKLTKRGAAGLIVSIIVLSYMMMISTSQFRILELENTGHMSKNLSKKAFFCAFSGVQFALERVRKDPTLLSWTQRPYFTFSSADFNARSTAEMSANPAGDEYIDDIYTCDPAFTVSDTNVVETGAGKMQFRLTTYPQNTALKNEYWVKSQGYYDDPLSQRRYSAQVIALIMLDPATNMFKLKKYQQMDIQTTVTVAGTHNDFFDWEYLL